MHTKIENKLKIGDNAIPNVNPLYFLAVQEYGDDEEILNVVSSKFPTYKSANDWLNNEATKIRFPHAYIISVY